MTEQELDQLIKATAQAKYPHTVDVTDKVMQQVRTTPLLVVRSPWRTIGVAAAAVCGILLCIALYLQLHSTCSEEQLNTFLAETYLYDNDDPLETTASEYLAELTLYQYE